MGFSKAIIGHVSRKLAKLYEDQNAACNSCLAQHLTQLIVFHLLSSVLLQHVFNYLVRPDFQYILRISIHRVRVIGEHEKVEYIGPMLKLINLNFVSQTTTMFAYALG